LFDERRERRIEVGHDLYVNNNNNNCRISVYLYEIETKTTYRGRDTEGGREVI